MKKCKSCGTKNAQENQFCENCGKEFKKCLVCGKSHEIKKVCPNIGLSASDFARKKWENYRKKIRTKETFKRFGFLLISFMTACIDLGWSLSVASTRTEKIRPIVLSVNQESFFIFLLLLNFVFLKTFTYREGFPFEEIYKEGPILSRSEEKIKKEFAEEFPEEAKYLK